MTLQCIFGTLPIRTIHIIGEQELQSISDHITDIRNALKEEQNALSLLPRTSLLTNGLRVAQGDHRSYYRFEIPDNFYMTPGMSIQCSIGSKLRFEFPALVADVHGQFVYFLLPCDMGEAIPELQCAWNPSEIVTRLSDRWASLSNTPIVEQLLNRKFPDNAVQAAREPLFPSTFSDSQKSALKQSAGRKISFVIGERARGKTGVAAALLFNAIREKKRILYLASTSNSLYDCMNEVALLNQEVAEESVAIIDAGLDLQPELSIPRVSMEGSVDPSVREGLKKLFSIIFAEHDYGRVFDLQTKIREKQKQIEEATAELNAAKEELNRLQNSSMIERMKQRINKTMIDEVQMMVQHKTGLVDRLKQQIAMLTKEEFKKESSLPVLLKEKQEIEKHASQKIAFVNTQTLGVRVSSKLCLATTLHQALLFDATLLSGFDIVCIDDAHALSLPVFFYCASLAKERCYTLADITEQPPQSVSQIEISRRWLQKNYFTFFQQEESDNHRFTVSMFPPDIVSELTQPGAGPSIFESILYHVVEQAPLPSSARGKIYFINTEDQRAVSTQFIGKKKILPYNEPNAKRTIECIKHSLMNGATTQNDILIVTPPSGQSLYLREQLHAQQCANVEIATLGAMRLCSKRAIILDLTVAGLDFTLRILDDKKSGVVKVADTFNTLLSTVLEDLYVVCDLSHFRTRYKGRFITQLLEAMISRSENISSIGNAARRFDDLSPDIRSKVLFAKKEDKLTNEYKSKLEQTKPSALDAAKSAPQQTVATADRRQKLEVRAVNLRVLAKREFINTIAQYLETIPLYKTTTETQKYSSALPDIDCENENDFKSVMDMWNLLIYETSNAQKSKHPLAEKAKVDSKISADIHQIYTYYHSDLEMVVEEGKHKLAQSIQKIFNDCIGKKPVTPTDWMNAYLVFLGRMEKYLDTVINQIRI